MLTWIMDTDAAAQSATPAAFPPDRVINMRRIHPAENNTGLEKCLTCITGATLLVISEEEKLLAGDVTTPPSYLFDLLIGDTRSTPRFPQCNSKYRFVVSHPQKSNYFLVGLSVHTSN